MAKIRSQRFKPHNQTCHYSFRYQSHLSIWQNYNWTADRNHYFSIMNHYLLFVCLSVRGGTLKWVCACALILLLCSSCRLLITSNMKTTQVRLETLCITAGMPWINPCGDIQISALGGFMTWSTLCLLIMPWKAVLGGKVWGRTNVCPFSCLCSLSNLYHF